MQNTFIVLWAFLLLSSCRTTSLKNTDDVRLGTPNQRSWVNDFEGLYSKEEIHGLDSIIKAFERQTGIEIVLVTLDTTVVPKEDFDDFTLALGNQWKVGKEGINNGILIGISRGYKKIRIHNGYGIEKLITDEETKSIIMNYFVPPFREGDYFQGTHTGLIQLIELLKTKLE